MLKKKTITNPNTKGAWKGEVKQRYRRIKNDDSTPELPMFEVQKRLCTRCNKNQIYLDIKGMDLCESCLWESVKEDFDND